MRITVLMIGLCILSIQDIKRRKISIKSILILAIFIPAAVWIDYKIYGCVPEVKHMMWSLVTGGFISVAGMLSGLMGAGDGIVVAFIGLLTDWRFAVAVFLLALFIISVVGAVILVLKKAGLKQEMPFIPFLFLSVLGVLPCL